MTSFCCNRSARGWGIVKGNFICLFDLKEVHASLSILNFLSALYIKNIKTESINRVLGEPDLELEKGIVVLLLCSVPDRSRILPLLKG